MRRFKKYGIWIGMVVVGVGVAYDIVIAGIPYQDGPDDLIFEYKLNHTIAIWMMRLGILIGAVSIFIKIADRLRGRD